MVSRGNEVAYTGIAQQILADSAGALEALANGDYEEFGRLMSGVTLDIVLKLIPGGAAATILSPATLAIIGRINLGDRDVGGNGGSGADAPKGELPDAESFFEGSRYTAKVEAQMASGDYHGFPSAIDDLSGSGTVTQIVGGDGVTRFKLEIPGEINGKTGVFEYIRNPDGTINHRLFRPDY